MSGVLTFAFGKFVQDVVLDKKLKATHPINLGVLLRRPGNDKE
jgi:hypothetical protein